MSDAEYNTIPEIRRLFDFNSYPIRDIAILELEEFQDFKELFYGIFRPRFSDPFIQNFRCIYGIRRGVLASLEVYKKVIDHYVIDENNKELNRPDKEFINNLMKIGHLIQFARPTPLLIKVLNYFLDRIIWPASGLPLDRFGLVVNEFYEGFISKAEKNIQMIIKSFQDESFKIENNNIIAIIGRGDSIYNILDYINSQKTQELYRIYPIVSEQYPSTNYDEIRNEFPNIICPIEEDIDIRNDNESKMNSIGIVLMGAESTKEDFDENHELTLRGKIGVGSANLIRSMLNYVKTYPLIKRVLLTEDCKHEWKTFDVSKWRKDLEFDTINFDEFNLIISNRDNALEILGITPQIEERLKDYLKGMSPALI